MYDASAADNWNTLKPYVLPRYDPGMFDDELAFRRSHAVQRAVESTFCQPVVDRSELQAIHMELYGGILLDEHAGYFREDDPRLRDALGFLEKVATRFFSLAETKAEKAHAMVAFHVELKGLRPFRIGSGFVARVITDAHCENLLGQTVAAELGRGLYLKDLDHARKTGDLGPLTCDLTGVRLPDELRRDYRPLFQQQIRHGLRH